MDSLGKLLKLEGYFVLTAYDGMEALQVLEKNPVDLILLDVMMPRLNGLSALMKIRERYKIPCIILSAKTEESDKVSGLVFKLVRQSCGICSARRLCRGFGGLPFGSAASSCGNRYSVRCKRCGQFSG